MDQEAIEASMADSKLAFDAAQEMYTKGKNSLPRTFQSLSQRLGDSEAALALPIFKVASLPCGDIDSNSFSLGIAH